MRLGDLVQEDGQRDRQPALSQAGSQVPSPGSVQDTLVESTLEELLQGMQSGHNTHLSSTGAQAHVHQTTIRKPGRADAAAQAAGGARVLQQQSASVQDAQADVRADVAQPAGRNRTAAQQAAGGQVTQALLAPQHRRNVQQAAAAHALSEDAARSPAGSYSSSEVGPLPH